MIRDIVGRLLTGFALVTYYFCGVWGLFATFGYLEERMGFLPAGIATLMLPISLPVTALIAGFADGNWSLLQIGLGGITLAIVTGMVGGMFKPVSP